VFKNFAICHFLQPSVLSVLKHFYEAKYFFQFEFEFFFAIVKDKEEEF